MALWRKLVGRSRGERDPLQILYEDIRTERESIVHHERLEKQIESRAVKEGLAALAREDREHLSRLEETLRSMGGIPQLEPVPEPVQMSVFEDLIQDWQHERDFQDRLREQMATMSDTKLKGLLETLYRAEKDHAARLKELVSLCS